MLPFFGHPQSSCQWPLGLHVFLRQLPCRWLSEKREETSFPDTQRSVLSLTSCSPPLGHVLSPHPRTGRTRWNVRVGPFPLMHGGVSKGWNIWLLLLKGNMPGGTSGKELACQCKKLAQETWNRSLGWEGPLEEGMATHSSILAWRIL